MHGNDANCRSLKSNIRALWHDIGVTLWRMLDGSSIAKAASSSCLSWACCSSDRRANSGWLSCSARMAKRRNSTAATSWYCIRHMNAITMPVNEACLQGRGSLYCRHEEGQRAKRLTFQQRFERGLSSTSTAFDAFIQDVTRRHASASFRAVLSLLISCSSSAWNSAMRRKRKKKFWAERQ